MTAPAELSAEIRAGIERVLALLAEGNPAQALAAIGALSPALEGSPVASYLVGLASKRLDEPGKALQALTLAHDQAPELREPIEALSILHAQLGRLVDALYFGKLTTAATSRIGIPGLVPAWFGDYARDFTHMPERPLVRSGQACLEQGHYPEAARRFRQEVEVDPGSADGWRGLAATRLRQGQPFDGLEAAETLLDLPTVRPADGALYGALLVAAGRPDEAIEAQRAAALDDPEDPALAWAPISTLARRARPDDTDLAEACADFVARFALPFDKPAPADPATLARRKLRLGVLSSHWQGDDGLDLIVPVLDALDRQRCELFVYADDPTRAPLARKLRGRANTWHDIASVDDDTVTLTMRNDALDLLIDLDGPIGCRRPVPLVSRPASLVLSLYGLPGAAAALGLDGVLTIPGGIAALPEDLLPTSMAPRRLDHAPVLGSLASPAAITPETIDLWAAILTALPAARLSLDVGTLGGRAAAAAMRARLAALVPGDRIALDEQPGGQADYLAGIDLLLDAPDNPYPDGAVGATGLGVPVLTCRSAQPRAAILADWLGRLRLAELVAADAASMVAAASAATSPEGYTRLQDTLTGALPIEHSEGARRQAFLLFDTVARMVVAGPAR